MLERVEPVGLVRARGCRRRAAPKPDTIAGMPRSANAARIGSEPPVRTSGRPRPERALDRAARAARSAGASGSKRDGSARSALEAQLGAVRQRVAQQRLERGARSRRILAAARAAPTGRRARPAARSCAPRRRATRWTSSEASAVGAHVELARAARASAGRAPTSASSVRAGGQRLPAASSASASARSRPRAAARAGGRRGRAARRASAACSAWNAFSAAPPYMPECAVALAGADLECGEHHAARARRQRGRLGVDHPAVEDDHASAPRSSASTHSPTSSEPVSSAPSISTRTWTGSSPASAIAQATCSSGRKLPLSSEAPRA